MVKKPLKRRIKRIVLVVLICACAGVLFGGRQLGMLLISYHSRYVECNSEELLSILEQTFEIDFPADIRDVKTAKTAKTGIDRVISYIVKFTAKPESANKFLASFPEGIAFDIPHYQNRDSRSAYVWPPPRWFTGPIRRGRRIIPNAPSSTYIYIDTTDEANYVVYLEGCLP